MEQRLESLATTDNSVLHMSRGLAFILLFVYISFLYYQMVTHACKLPSPTASPPHPADVETRADRPRPFTDLYMPQERGPNDPPPPPNDLPYIEGPQPPTEGGVFRIPSLPSAWGGSSSTSSASSSSASTLSVDEHTPKLSMRASFLLLVTVTVLTVSFGCCLKGERGKLRGGDVAEGRGRYTVEGPRLTSSNRSGIHRRVARLLH